MSSHLAPSHYEAPTPSPNHLNPNNITLDILNKQRHHSISSSEEAEDAHQTSNNGWQIIRRTKRKKKLYSSQPVVQTPQTETQKRYDILT